MQTTFISLSSNKQNVKEIQKFLQKHELYANVSETDITVLSKENDAWKLTLKKSEFLIGGKESSKDKNNYQPLLSIN